MFEMVCIHACLPVSKSVSECLRACVGTCIHQGEMERVSCERVRECVIVAEDQRNTNELESVHQFKKKKNELHITQSCTVGWKSDSHATKHPDYRKRRPIDRQIFADACTQPNTYANGAQQRLEELVGVTLMVDWIHFFFFFGGEQYRRS
jgi:hypothetical protein